MQLLSILKKFKNQRILVIGDLILDCYIWGKVSRISPEAPVPVVDVIKDTFLLGGAANVASNIVSLGGQATVMGVIGKDRAADTMRNILSESGIDFLGAEDDRPTTVKTRVIAHSQQMVRFDQENREKLSGRTLHHMIDNIKSAVKDHDAVIVSDYKKGVITGEVMKALLKAGRNGKFIAVDPKVGHFHLYNGVSIITPNALEASQGAGIEIRDGQSLIAAGSRLLKKHKLKAVLITRGEDGMSLFYDGMMTNIPTMARKVYDVTGAGDTVIAAYTLAMASGASMEEAAVISNHAAGIVVAEVGTATTTTEQVGSSIRELEYKIERVKL